MVLTSPIHPPWQAIARIYRIGQTNATYVYRLMYKNTMEEVVYRVSVDKEVSWSVGMLMDQFEYPCCL